MNTIIHDTDAKELNDQLVAAMRECAMAAHFIDEDMTGASLESAYAAYLSLRDVMDRLEAVQQLNAK